MSIMCGMRESVSNGFFRVLLQFYFDDSKTCSTFVVGDVCPLRKGKLT